MTIEAFNYRFSMRVKPEFAEMLDRAIASAPKRKAEHKPTDEELDA